jgi:hypothetical protein
MKGLKIEYLKLQKELENYSDHERFYSYELWLNKKFDSVDALKLFLCGVGKQRKLLISLVEKGNSDQFRSDKPMTAEDTVDEFLRNL